jgi:hypothetical protein
VANNNGLSAAKLLKEEWQNTEMRGDGFLFPKRELMEGVIWTFCKNPPSAIFSDRALDELFQKIDFSQALEAEEKLVLCIRNELRAPPFVIITNQEERFKKNPETFAKLAKAGVSMPGVHAAKKVLGSVWSDGPIVGPILRELDDADFDVIFIFLNDCQPKTTEVADYSWTRRTALFIRDLINENDRSAIHRFLHLHPDFSVLDYGKKEDGHPLYRDALEYSKKTNTKEGAGKFLVIVGPTKFIPTFSADFFKKPVVAKKTGEVKEKGDLTKRMEHCEELMNGVLDCLEEAIKATAGK